MPLVINEGQNEASQARMEELLEEYTYERRYPQGMKLKPTDDQHGTLVTRLRIMLDASWAEIKDRHADWDKVDTHLTSYIDLSKDQKEDDAAEGYIKDKAVQIVVPMSYAILETLITYLIATFTERPMFRYDWVGDSDADVVGAMALEHIQDIQMTRSKAGLALHTQWRDSIAKGIGVIGIRWNVDYKPIHDVSFLLYRIRWRRGGVFCRMNRYCPDPPGVPRH